MGVPLIPDEVRAKAELYYGDASGQQKARFLLTELGLPEVLLPLRDILECGFVEETGFLWVRQARRVQHHFAGGVNRTVSYAPFISAYMDREAGRLTKVKGIHARELLVWVPVKALSAVRGDHGYPYRYGPKSSAPPAPAERLLFRGPAGISRVYPASAFLGADHRKAQMRYSRSVSRCKTF